MFEIIKDLGNNIATEIIEIRRYIHSNPELGFEEYQTAGLVYDKLSELGFEVTKGIAGTGVSALLKIGEGKKTIGLRADMDALPVQEMSDVPYRSQRDGVMHACGHDAHVAMLLGAAKILSLMREQLKANVKFIFQPCEETPPGGAEPMIEAGVLDNPKVDAIFGLHVNPYIQSGYVGIKEDVVMAAADEFTIEITGKGGHGAAPHQTVDPILVSSHVIQGLQAIVSRQVDPLEPVVISVCSIKGGTSFNVIPDKVFLSGTVRTLNPGFQRQMPERIKKAVKGITGAFGADVNIDYRWGYPALANNKAMVEIVREAAVGIIGGNRIINVKAASMGAEDFACFSSRVPGAYFFLGVQPANGDVYPWHSPKFDIDELSLPAGASLLAGCALQAGITLEKQAGIGGNIKDDTE